LGTRSEPVARRTVAARPGLLLGHRSGGVQHRRPVPRPASPGRSLPAAAGPCLPELLRPGHPGLPGPPPAPALRRRGADRLQEGPLAGGAGQTPGEEQLAEDVRQVRPGAAHRDGHQPAARVQGPSPPSTAGAIPDGLVPHEQGGGQLLPLSRSRPRCQRTLPQRLGGRASAPGQPQGLGTGATPSARWPSPTARPESARQGGAEAVSGRAAWRAPYQWLPEPGHPSRVLPHAGQGRARAPPADRARVAPAPPAAGAWTDCQGPARAPLPGDGERRDLDERSHLCTLQSVSQRTTGCSITTQGKYARGAQKPQTKTLIRNPQGTFLPSATSSRVTSTTVAGARRCDSARWPRPS